MPKIEAVWARIKSHAGEAFYQIRGKEFTYSVEGASLRPSTTNRLLPRSHFERALALVPLAYTTPIRSLQGPSFIFAILMDQRVRLRDW